MTKADRCPDFDHMGAVCAHCDAPTALACQGNENPKPPVVLDTDVLLALCKRADRAHDLALTLVPPYRRAGHAIVVPAPAYTEVLASCHTPHAVLRTRIMVASFTHHVHPLDEVAARGAAEYRRLHPEMSMTTACTLATADVINAGYILTMDDMWAYFDERIVLLAYSYRVPTENAIVVTSQQSPEDRKE